MTIRSHGLAAAFAAVAALGLALPAQARNSADPPPDTRPARTLKKPQNRAVAGVQRGTEAAGRGIDRADSAARRGIQRGAEAASRPVRDVGETLGRKLVPGSSGRALPPPVGPQGDSP